MKFFTMPVGLRSAIRLVCRQKLVGRLLGWLVSCLWMGCPSAIAQSDREWEIARFNRQETIRNRLTDSLMHIQEDNSLIGVSYGNYFMPWIEAVSEKNTYINMRQSHRVINLSYDKFLTQDITLGVELGLHFLKQTMNVSGSRIKGGGGLVNTAMIQIKYFFPASATAPKRRVYVLAGSGFTQSLVVSISASTTYMSSADPDVFVQSSGSVNAGAGVFWRLGKYLATDVSMRYFYSHPYDPYIGSVRSFSPIQIDLRLSGILHSGFGRLEKRLRP